MKYVECPELADVNDALNIERNDLFLIGGCDLYICKAAGEDKRLYSEIENELQEKHRSLLRLAASLPPTSAARFAASTDLTRASPFGRLSEYSNRRAFAYMVATLNATYPDYNFANVLQPDDFRRERRLETVIQDVNERVLSFYGRNDFGRLGTHTPGGSSMWRPDMWRKIDQEMDLEDCQIYNFQPEVNPLRDDELANSMWSIHFFFFNKSKKRVCCLYAQAVKASVSAYPNSATATPKPKRSYSARSSGDFTSAGKRARYWLGDRADEVEVDGDEDDDVQITVAPGDDDVIEVDIDPELVEDLVRGGRSLSPSSSYGGSAAGHSDDDQPPPAAVAKHNPVTKRVTRGTTKKISGRTPIRKQGLRG